MTDGIAFNRMADRLRDLGVPTKYGGGALRAQGICHDARSIGAVSIRRGNNGSLVVWCHACNDNKGFLDAIGWTLADLHDEPMPERERDDRRGSDGWIPCKRDGHRKVAEYIYRDEQGAVVHGVTRCDHKCFGQWRPDADGPFGRRWKLTDDARNRLVRLVPYRLPELLAAKAADRVIWIAEGEKDVHALVDHGLPATCNAEGSGKWTAEHARHLEGADVTIVADRDPKGREHAEKVVATLRGVARSVYVVQARTGKDAADHFAAGHTDSEFIQVWAPVPYPGDPETSA